MTGNVMSQTTLIWLKAYLDTALDIIQKLNTRKEHVVGRTINELKKGDSAAFTKVITHTDIMYFTLATGDDQPIHSSEQFARKTRFGRRIAHGMLSAGLISAAIGTELPGNGTIYVRQTLDFKRPVFLSDTVTATVTVIKIDRKRSRVILSTVCTNQNDEIVLCGEAEVMPPLLTNKK